MVELPEMKNAPPPHPNDKIAKKKSLIFHLGNLKYSNVLEQVNKYAFTEPQMLEILKGFLYMYYHVYFTVIRD